MPPDLFAKTTLTENGLRSLLRLRGGLPDAHRFTAWKFLLRLPGNWSCFHEFVRKGPHPGCVASLAIRYPLRDRKLYRKTAVLTSALAHWSPIWAEAEFVPGWVFPFVVVFRQVRASTCSNVKLWLFSARLGIVLTDTHLSSNGRGLNDIVSVADEMIHAPTGMAGQCLMW